MKIINQFISLFRIDFDEKLEIEERNRVLLSNLFNFFMFVIVFIEGIYALMMEVLLFAGPLLMFSLIHLVSFLFLSRQFQSSYYRSFILLMSFISLSFFALYGGNSGLGIVWSFVFPLFVINIFGKKKGTLYSFILLTLITIIIWLLSDIVPGAQSYSISVKLTISAIYLLSYIIAYALQFISSEVILNKEKIMLNSQNFSRSQEEHISRLSHQIRTPLSNITGIINILERTPLNDDQRDYINTIHASANNLVGVVNSMVNTQQSGLNSTSGDEVTFNLYSIINNTLQLFSEDKKNTKFSISLSADIPTNVIGSPIRTKQILLNIFNSIIKNNKEESRQIFIDVSQKSTMPGIVDLVFKISSNFLLPISGNSPGNESAYNQDIIHLNTSRFVHVLELHLTQRLIEADGKAINIFQEDDMTVVEFGITFKESTRSQSIINIQDNHRIVETIANAKVDIKNANILLVEDNFSNQQIIILYIKNEVNRIDVAFNGKEALDKFGKAKYDLILMDVQMPIMDGFKATQKIREVEKSTNTHTPIIAVTANAFPEDKERCIASGMDDYISKPFQPDELIGKIKKYLQ